MGETVWAESQAPGVCSSHVWVINSHACACESTLVVCQGVPNQNQHDDWDNQRIVPDHMQTPFVVTLRVRCFGCACVGCLHVSRLVELN